MLFFAALIAPRRTIASSYTSSQRHIEFLFQFVHSFPDWGKHAVWGSHPFPLWEYSFTGFSRNPRRKIFASDFEVFLISETFRIVSIVLSVVLQAIAYAFTLFGNMSHCFPGHCQPLFGLENKIQRFAKKKITQTFWARRAGGNRKHLNKRQMVHFLFNFFLCSKNVHFYQPSNLFLTSHFFLTCNFCFHLLYLIYSFPPLLISSLLFKKKKPSNKNIIFCV